MNVGTMRAVDRFAGIPLCWITGLWNFLFRSGPSHSPPKTILVIKFFGLGSVLLSTTFLAALRDSHPNARLVYLTFESNKELLERLPQPDIRLTISTKSLRRLTADTFTVLRVLRELSVDVVFDLEFFSKFSTLISTLSGAPARVGYALPTRWRKGNLTHPVELDTKSHVTHAFLRQLSGIGIRAANPTSVMRLHATASEEASMQSKLGLGSNGIEIIVVNINAGTTSLERRWMPERFIDIVNSMMHANPARKFYFIGSAEEQVYVAGCLQGMSELNNRIVNCAGQLTLGELIALLERATILLTNDSGPMHIAASVGTRIVALFGPESPSFYGPVVNARILCKAISCSPCLNIYDAKAFVCPYNSQCMREISTDEVLTAMNEVISTPLVAR